MTEKRFLPKQHLNKKERQKIIEEIKTYFSKQEQVVFAYILGSFSEEKPFRDIDVSAYFLEDKEELAFESDLSFELSRKTGYPVEVIVLNHASVSFQLSVLKKGTLLLSKSEDIRTDFIDDVSRRYREYSHFRNLALEAEPMKISVDMDRILKAKMDLVRVSDQIDQFFGNGVKDYLSDPRNALSLKYLLIEAVEAMADICQHLLAKAKGMVCEGYVDCLVKAGEAGIITSALAQKLRKLADLRNILIHRYWVVDDEKIYTQTMKNKQNLRKFIDQVDDFVNSLKR